MEIKEKKNSFILYGNKNAFIINDKKIINQITLDNKYKNFIRNKLIYQINEYLFILSGMRYITVINVNENKFKQIYFLKEVKTVKKDKYDKENNPYLYKYNSNSIIIISYKGIFIIQWINNEKVQVNIFIRIEIKNIIPIEQIINSPSDCQIERFLFRFHISFLISLINFIS